MISQDAVRFLNRTETISGPDAWNRRDLPKLWLYNLHYFDDLVAENAAERCEWHQKLVDRWIAENPAPEGNGWEPYPTSLRIVNWAKWALAGNSLSQSVLDSIATQADWLSRNLEYHLLGNHLFANAKALVFAAAIIRGEQAQRWRALGLSILTRELPEQQLANGGQFELSPMYHGIFTEDLLDLLQLGTLDADIPREHAKNWKEAAVNAIGWMNGMTHPDGEIAFFNDGAFRIAPAPTALSAYAGRLGVNGQPTSEHQTYRGQFDGYTRLSAGTAVALCDTAAIGPDYLPGHAHADTLSFELSVGGHRVVVNGGTSVYGGNPERRHFERSTAAHNTVTIDDQSSSEIWADFRVARRARITEHRVETNEQSVSLSATHDGFLRFGGPLHRRTWILSENSLQVIDQLEHGWDRATARMRLAPPFSCDGGEITGPVSLSVLVEGAQMRVETGDWAPEFGKTVPCQILCLDFTGPCVVTKLSWHH